MKRLLFYLPLVVLFAGCTKNLKENIVAKIPGEKTMLAKSELLTASSDFKGMNWADPANNFNDNALVISGLNSSDSYATTAAKAINIVNAFKQRGANTIRIPINPPTTSSAWWNSYVGAIDTAANSGMKVIIAYWEAYSSQDGVVDNLTQFWAMWQAVVNRYSGNDNVYFEVFNEPHGYSLANLNNLYADWLSHYPNVPRNRIMLDGAGYAGDVNGVGADSRFSSCLLSFHDYTWFEPNKHTSAEWETAINALAYPDRTVVTEFGVPMTTSVDYLAAPGSNVDATYYQGMTNGIRNRGIGCVYWPGLCTGDYYSITAVNGGTVTTTNISGLTRLQYAWGLTNITQPAATFDGNAWYKMISLLSGKAVDVYNSSTSNGGTINQWAYWGGNNQQWKMTDLGSGKFAITNRNSNKSLDTPSNSGGTGIIQWDYWGGVNQQWNIIDIGFGYYQVMNVSSGMALDVNGGSTANGASIIQWYWNAGGNQQWQIVKL
ncbi:MAG: RICIN domain-containing protein [Chitinophaga sp.]|uniref:RICIN domain-containing protein n=1 Tax=Chitinophaga sp. TaxID=1869181 RepID=UPI001B2CCABB|nr:RICIN domain-containing protein [Chitinophaga sp.]MBO9727783.1 RICIN domain-containing protein [Chitinophaga sp.]